MDNTEGSLVITKTFRARKNLELRLTNCQMSIILGSILGDAYIHKLGKICFEHTSKHKSYLLWKYTELQNLTYPKVAQVERLDKRTNTKTFSYRFYLRQYFKNLRNIFYNDNDKKIIPSDLINWMNPLVLATWYMDDGHLDKNKYPYFMTESFSIKDIEKLIYQLKILFSLDCKITSKNRILIHNRNSKHFFNLIEPHIHETFKYKLP
jgi:hypothetical protein